MAQKIKGYTLGRTLCIGLYVEDGTATKGEFTMSWKQDRPGWKRGPTIEIHGDAFHLFTECSDFFSRLSEKGGMGSPDISKAEVFGILQDLGYKAID